MITGQIMYNKCNVAVSSNKDRGSGSSEGMSARQKADAYIRQGLEDYAAGISGYTEEEKNEYVSNIYRKYRSGKKLSAKEMNYLRQNDPETYMHAMRVRLKRNILEDKLKRCRTKRQAQEIYDEAVVSIGEKDPDKEVLIRTYQDAWNEFKKSGEYARLKNDTKDEYTILVEERVYAGCVYSDDAAYSDTYSEDALYDVEA